MLPENATSHSLELLALAQDLIQTCPKSLYDEITLSGSVSRGVADEFSDIDLNFWTPKIESVETYQAWIKSLPADAVECRPAWQPREESRHLEYKIDGVKYNLLWQSWDELDTDLLPLNQHRLPSEPSLPWMIAHAIPLTDTPRFSIYQAQLRDYPEELRHNLIHHHLEIWRHMLHVPQIFFATAQIQRRQIPDLRRRQLMTIESILTVMFAYNRVWQPDFKWFEVESEGLTHKPPQLIERIHQLLSTASYPDTLHGMVSLMQDTLVILSDPFAVDDLVTKLGTL